MLAEKYALYQFQIQEIKKSQLQNDEDLQLENERKILINAEKFMPSLPIFMTSPMGIRKIIYLNW